jgi:hypothetical protein
MPDKNPKEINALALCPRRTLSALADEKRYCPRNAGTGKPVLEKRDALPAGQRPQGARVTTAPSL